MIDPRLQAYLTTCLQQNYTPEQLRATLLSSGWTPQAIDEALAAVLPPTPIPAALVATKPKRRFPRWIGATLVFLVVIIITPIAFAEHGYLPAFSKIYRKTSLPLLWHGTTGNASITVLQVAQAISKAPELQDNAQYSLTLSATDKKPVSLKQFPLLSDLLGQPKSSTYAAVISPGNDSNNFSANPTSTPSLDPNSYLPLTIKATALTEYDAQQNYHLKWSIDLGDTLSKIPQITQFVPGVQKVSTLEGALIHSENAAYFRSSLIPYLTTADQDKWLRFVIPADLLKQFDDARKNSSNYTKEDLAAYQEILSAAITDNGIIRQDNHPYAQYHILITPTILKSLANRPTLSKYKTTLNETAAEQLTVDATILLDPQTARLAFSDLTWTTLYLGTNTFATLHAQDAFTYNSTPVTAPDSSQIIKDGEGYLLQVEEQEIGKLEGTSSGTAATSKIQAENALRKNDISELGKAMEVYLADDQNGGKPPTTNNQIERLDTTTNALYKLGNKFLFTLPIKDPIPNTLYYSYQSDGTNYQITAFLTSDTDSSKIIGTYSVKNGTTIDSTNP